MERFISRGESVSCAKERIKKCCSGAEASVYISIMGVS